VASTGSRRVKSLTGGKQGVSVLPFGNSRGGEEREVCGVACQEPPERDFALRYSLRIATGNSANCFLIVESSARCQCCFGD
jgi:hypothetical protein